MWPETEKLLRDAGTELVFGLVAPVGIDLDSFERTLRDQLGQYAYASVLIRLSELLRPVAPSLGVDVRESPEVERLRTYMDAGNRARERTGVAEILAVWAIAGIDQQRTHGARRPRTAYVLRSIKHPDEARALRAVYGAGFYLIGVHAPRVDRKHFLEVSKGMTAEDAAAAIARDEGEDNAFGQQTRDAFELADVFIQQHRDTQKTTAELARFLRLVFGSVTDTPTEDEHAMFLAYAASLASGDLSRQVGAVVWRDGVGVVATGRNDVPRAGGGLYWPGNGDQRDHILGVDANHAQRDAIVAEVSDRVAKALGQQTLTAQVAEAARKSRLVDITEYGRAVHAEMDALLSCARAGVSTRRGRLYSTTFPCHNCAKHIIAAGIARVIFIEPYEKSQARILHGDALVDDAGDPGGTEKVVFERFVGVGPRRYFDLFSLRLSSGYVVRRKSGAQLAAWTKAGAIARVGLAPTSYLEREKQILRNVPTLLEAENETET